MKLVEILIFCLFYFLTIGIVSSIFNPGLYSVSTGIGYPYSMPNPVFDFGNAFFSFIEAGLSLDIPDIPAIVKLVMLLPMYGALAYFIYCNIPGLIGRKEG